jgi:dolichol-phosphate mannosyltransferase
MKKFNNITIAVVIPYYNAAKHISHVVEKLPDFVTSVFIVDDRGLEPLPIEQLKLVCKDRFALELLQSPHNLGVGGATKIGFMHALSTHQDIVVKIDADDQMNTSYLEEMIVPIVERRSDMVKGNRFVDTRALLKMPLIRRIGNLGISFMAKAATGYWGNFDPTNGFLVIHCDALKKIDFEKLENSYFFETSLLSEFNFIKARVKDFSMPAIYGDEKSSMQVWRMPFLFSRMLFKLFLKRIIKQYFLFDFNIASLYIFFGVPLFLFGVISGLYNWWYYSSRDLFAPTGTIMIDTLSIILGFQLLLQAIQYDIFNAPKSE